MRDALSRNKQWQQKYRPLSASTLHNKCWQCSRFSCEPRERIPPRSDGGLQWFRNLAQPTTGQSRLACSLCSRLDLLQMAPRSSELCRMVAIWVAEQLQKTLATRLRLALALSEPSRIQGNTGSEQNEGKRGVDRWINCPRPRSAWIAVKLCKTSCFRQQLSLAKIMHSYAF